MSCNEPQVHSEGVEDPWLDDWNSSESPEPGGDDLSSFQESESDVSILSMSAYDNIGESATAGTIRSYLSDKQVDRRVFMTVLHNSATPASADHGLLTVKSFARYHMNNRGWKAIGYHFVIDTKGVIWAGRKMSVVGSHAGSKGNPGSIGVCLVGNFETADKPTEAQKESLAALHTALCDLYYGSVSRQIRFHREFMSTGCPGKITEDEVMGWVNGYHPVTPPIGATTVIHFGDKIIGTATVIGNTSYTPIRSVFEKMGFKVEWDAAKFVANMTSPGKMPVPIGNVAGTAEKPKIVIDGKASATGMMILGSTYAPVRAIFESAGYEVEWKGGGVHVSEKS